MLAIDLQHRPAMQLHTSKPASHAHTWRMTKICFWSWPSILWPLQITDRKLNLIQPTQGFKNDKLLIKSTIGQCTHIIHSCTEWSLFWLCFENNFYEIGKLLPPPALTFMIILSRVEIQTVQGVDLVGLRTMFKDISSDSKLCKNCIMDIMSLPEYHGKNW